MVAKKILLSVVGVAFVLATISFLTSRRITADLHSSLPPQPGFFQTAPPVPPVPSPSSISAAFTAWQQSVGAAGAALSQKSTSLQNPTPPTPPQPQTLAQQIPQPIPQVVSPTRTSISAQTSSLSSSQPGHTSDPPAGGWKVPKRDPNVSWDENGNVINHPVEDYLTPLAPSQKRNPKYEIANPRSSPETQCSEGVNDLTGYLDKVRDYGGPDTAMEYYRQHGDRLAIVSMFSGPLTGLRLASENNKKEYAERYNHKFYPITKDELNIKLKAPHYYKIPAIRKYLKEHDWIMWIDADTVFVNQRKRLTDIIDDRYDVIITDNRAPEHKNFKFINTGALLVRNTEWSQQFLTDWVEWCESHHPRNENGDQGALIEMLKSKAKDYTSHVKRVNFRTMNSEFPYCMETDLVVHFPGRGGSEKKFLVDVFMGRTQH